MLIFSKKKEKYRNLHSTIQNKTLIQRKSTCNIMNKMQDERETQTKFSTESKNSYPLHLQIDFSDKLPLQESK